MHQYRDISPVQSPSLYRGSESAIFGKTNQYSLGKVAISAAMPFTAAGHAGHSRLQSR